jgi:ribonuclease PH
MSLSNCFSPIIADDIVSDEKATENNGAMYCSLGTVCDASGSSFVSDNNSVVQVAVHGPRAFQKGNVNLATLDCDVRYAPFVKFPSYSTIPYDFNKGLALSESIASSGQTKQAIEKLISEILKESILGMICTKKYPNMLISVHATLLSSSGNIGQDLATVITASSVALADASIEMMDMVAASTVTLQIPANEKSKPTVCKGITKGEYGNCSFLTVSSRCNAPEVTQMWSEGRMQVDGLFSLLQEACQMNSLKKTQIEGILLEKLRCAT